MTRRIQGSPMRRINLLNVVLVAMVTISATVVDALIVFLPPGLSISATSTRQPIRPLLATKKGFGSDDTSSRKKRIPATSSSADQEEEEQRQPPQTSVESMATTPKVPSASAPFRSTSTSVGAMTTRTEEANAGQRALAEMRRRRVEEKDDELRRVRELVAMDKQVQSSPASAAIPEPVAQRMGKRMLPFVGLPLFGIMGAFVTFWYFATYKNLEFDTSLVAISTIGILVLGLLGITYSVMSASWDPDREGSALGFDEFQRNAQSLQDGFGRSRENAILREKMTGLSSSELEAALSDLEQREMTDTKRQQSLQDKLRNEME